MDCPDVSVTTPAEPRGTYGADLAFHVDGAHFTVQWDDPGVDATRATAIADRLEAAWARLVDGDGWEPPTSSDRWRLWVILTEELAGSGYTTPCVTDDYPDGYPVTWLNPAYELDDPAYGLSVAVHEFGHALQHRVREHDPRAEELWFWEASAEWLAERGAPDLDAYAASSRWYAEWPEGDAESVADQHDYGMFLLDAWLEEQAIGADGVRDLWRGSTGELWTDAIAARTGMPFGEVIREMAGAIAAHGLRESSVYAEPERLDTLDGPTDRAAPRPGRYGTWYVDVAELRAGEEVYVEGDLLVGYAQEGWWGPAAPEEGAFVMTLTREGDGTGDFSYGVRAAEVPIAEGCGCGGRSPGNGWILAGFALAVRRRRSGDRRATSEAS